MMTINQSALANAVINVTGNTRGLEHAIGESKKQMHGFMVFAQAIGGRVGGTLANMFAMGGAGPLFNSFFGNRVGGSLTNVLNKTGLMRDPIGDVAAAMDQAKRRYRNDLFAHKMAATNIAVGQVYDGRLLRDAHDVKVARAKHSMKTPKMADYTQGMVAGAAEEAQNLAMQFGKLGLAVVASYKVFGVLIQYGSVLDQAVRRATRVFGSSLGAAESGYRFGSNMTRSQYLAGASGIGMELRNAGVGRGSSSAMASNLTQRAGRLSAAWSADFEDVAGKVQDAVGGSNTALREFGVVLSDDLVRAQAFNSGLIKLGEVMTSQVEAQARYRLVLAQIDAALENNGASFFDLKNQWNTFTSGFTTALEGLGSILAPITAGVLGVTNAFASFLASIAKVPAAMGAGVYQHIKNALGFGGGSNDAAIDKSDMLANAKNDAKRADDVIQRERARQSSNVGYHNPEDFYNHIQKGIFGDPAEFQKRQTDLMHEFVVVSKEQLAVLRDFGYKVKDGSALLQP
jgi:hypothetical protein